MTIGQIREEFGLSPLENEEEIEWIDVNKYADFLFGVYYDENVGCYCRMPFEVAEKVNDGVKAFCTHTAGGRIRFSTDSPFIALKALIDTGIMYHMPFTGIMGFGLYVNKRYYGPLAPSVNDYTNRREDRQIAFQVIVNVDMNPVETIKDKEIEIYFPQCCNVKNVYIGLKKGSSLQSAKPYKQKAPVVFYGSSITQGCCTSHPGNDYAGYLCRWLDVDFINLGFMGSAKGEQIMANYLASINASAFVIDYDHNAPDVESLKATHSNFYNTVRTSNPNTPIILISRPDWNNFGRSFNHIERRAVIYDTYKRAKKRGEAVWFIDGEKLFGKHEQDACTVDLCHPNDLGFYRMAKGIAPVLRKVLKKATK